MRRPRFRPLLLLAAIAVGCGGGRESGSEAESDDAGGRDAGASAEAPAAGGEGEADAGEGETEVEVSFPPTESGLAKLMGQLNRSIASGDGAEYERLMRSLRLPDHEAWFREHFRERAARRLAEEYEPIHEEIGQMKGVLEGYLDKGLKNIEPYKFGDPEAPSATGYQSRALEAMTDPVPLYSVRLSDETRDKAFHLWSFVHVGGTFRFVGKMKEIVREDPPVEDDHDLLELRNTDRERYELGKKLDELKEKREAEASN